MVNIPKLKEKPVQLYEVIRIIDNIPLFLEDHLERLFRTARLNNIANLPPYHEIVEKILNMIDDENRKMGNLKLTFTVTPSKVHPIMDIEFIPHFYPAEEKYTTGVKTGILEAERPNPQAKIQNMELRNKANLIMSKENVYEVLLIDHEGNITEGSRSNIFFIKGNQLFTAPDDKVLQGITRKKILELCDSHKIKVVKTAVPFSGLDSYTGAFLTGSSPKVLPVYSIHQIQFEPGLPLIRKIIDLYDKEIEFYLKSKQSPPNNI